MYNFMRKCYYFLWLQHFAFPATGNDSSLGSASFVLPSCYCCGSCWILFSILLGVKWYQILILVFISQPLMMLNTIWQAYLPTVYLLWWNVSSECFAYFVDLTCWSQRVLTILWRQFIIRYVICKYFLSLCIGFAFS